MELHVWVPRMDFISPVAPEGMQILDEGRAVLGVSQGDPALFVRIRAAQCEP